MATSAHRNGDVAMTLLEQFAARDAAFVRGAQKAHPTRQDDEDILHAMRFLGTDSPEQASRWLAELAEQDGAAE